MMQIADKAALQRRKDAYLAEQAGYERRVLICGGAGCVSLGCSAAEESLNHALQAHGLADRVQIVVTGCMGICAAGPVMLVEPDGIFYTAMTPERVLEVVERHLVGGEVAEEFTFYDSVQKRHVPKMNEITFFKEQLRVVLRNCGQMEYSSLDAYISRDGYFALAKALGERKPADVVDEMKSSGLRGRGGAGFPTGLKWEAGMKAAGDQKYMVCNADQGDPGAFMDCSVLEGDPHSVIEGMLLGGYAIGAQKG